MSNALFVMEVIVSCVTQVPTLVVAALVTLAALWCRNHSYDNQTAWTVGLFVVLCLWAIFPHGYHLVLSPDVKPHTGGGIAPDVPRYGAYFLADVILTFGGWLIAKKLWDRNN